MPSPQQKAPPTDAPSPAPSPTFNFMSSFSIWEEIAGLIPLSAVVCFVVSSVVCEAWGRAGRQRLVLSPAWSISNTAGSDASENLVWRQVNWLHADKSSVGHFTEYLADLIFVGLFLPLHLKTLS